MTNVIADITMSLDGFVTGPNASPKAGLGVGGMPLHDWVFNGHDVDEAVLANATQRSGAVVMGRNLFDVVDGPGGWSDEVGYGAHYVGRPPFFIVTHNPPAQVRLDLDFTFVTEGVAPALDAARAVCPPDKDVVIMGGGEVIAQAIDQGLVDEMVLHVSPIVMGAGTPLWAGGARHQLHQAEVRVSPFATHITYTLPESGKHAD
jgi:dihydrofolate reductase